MAPGRPIREQVAKETIEESEVIVNQTPHASPASVFIPELLPPLPSNADGEVEIPQVLHPLIRPLSQTIRFPSFPSSSVTVLNSDAFTVALNLINASTAFKELCDNETTLFTTDAARTGVLNLASDLYPGGNWDKTLSVTQEEALCYSSTLFKTLKPSYYPWPNRGQGCVAGVLSPGVVIFRKDLDNNLEKLPREDWRVVQVLTVAGPRAPRLSQDREEFANPETLEELRGKLRLTYRMAAWSGCWDLVLGALGCGAYRCPAKLVAREMKAILCEPEFKGWFRKVTFAVYSTADNGGSNFDIFKGELDGVQL
ncbi:hypothetical protein HYDPIDRAFT_131629 [Hydnomerulius pinastri MD-312]|uniref:Microbial-type PARG catalytic domain-containing protein n=1 Tax=Hydnomerulius pinastri MD-312 TaxID=994086 RepID=A0A0C9WB14_9AGAM|nr:hypothetical protein HYDPIDRAFT_131629 [Hydnomerulius pinastri MD-312]